MGPSRSIRRAPICLVAGPSCFIFVAVGRTLRKPPARPLKFRKTTCPRAGFAQLYRDRGDLKKADVEFRWFVHQYNQADIKDPDLLLLVGLAGCENARWNNVSDQFEFILNEVYADALKIEKDFWPAEYESGALL